MTKRAGLYLRVSSELQLEGHSLEAQERLAREYCQAREWEIAQVYLDRGLSARSDKRPEFQRMMADAEAGSLSVVIVYKFDRFARNAEDANRYMKRLLKWGVTFVSLSENFDATTPMGYLQMQIMAALAEFYSANLSQEYRKGKRERVAKGLWNADPPFGYLKDETGRLQPDPHDAQGVLLAFQSYATSAYSDSQIAQLLNRHGYLTLNKTGRRAWSKDTVRAMLTNRFYLGLVSYKGDWFPGQHSALVTGSLFQEAHRARTLQARRHDHAREESRLYLLSGLLYCRECGVRYRGQANPTQGRIYYAPARAYGFECAQRATIPAPEVEERTAGFLASIQLPPGWRSKILEEARGRLEQAETSQVQRGRLEARLKRAERLFLIGDWSESQYQAEKRELQRQISELPIPSPSLDLDSAAKLISDFGSLYRMADEANRKRLFRAVLERAYLQGGDLVAVQPQPAFYPLMLVCQHGPDGIRVPTNKSLPFSMILPRPLDITPRRLAQGEQTSTLAL